MALPPPERLTPPILDQPLTEKGTFSQAWSGHMQDVTDRLADMPAKVRKGVVDGSSAAAGDIGEFLTATFNTPVSMPNGVATDVGTLALPAGDWDCRGEVVYTSSGGNMTVAQAWVSPTAVTPPPRIGRTAIVLVVGAMGTGTALESGELRVSAAAAGTLYLGGFAQYPSGTVTAVGALAARRVR